MTKHTIDIIAIALTAAGSYMFFSMRILQYLRYFQQEDYIASRFYDWYIRKKAFDRKGSSTALASAAVSLITPIYGPLVTSILAAAVLFFIVIKEEDPRISGKITLKITARTNRILTIATTLYIIVIIGTSLLTYYYSPYHSVGLFWLVQIILFQLHPVFLTLSNWILQPYEKQVQKKFANQARAKIKHLQPYVIGITGSYGKTSTKVILAQILGNAKPTFYPPGSINTYMGVTREIREHLKPEHKFAIIEMGAYQPGSIKRLCSLTSPQAAIITAIGEMHMERFGTPENVYKAKSELAHAIPQSGILIVNGDNESCRKLAQQCKKQLTLIYGMDLSLGHLDAYLFEPEMSETGSTKFKIRWRNKVYDGATTLLGKHMLSNLLAAFTMSCAIDCSPEFVLAAIRNIKAEPNRLEPMRVPISTLPSDKPPDQRKHGIILRLNDAFNSNPTGFFAALEVLGNLPSKGKKILVTPGMIELGNNQAQENRKMAALATRICNLVLVVGQTNRQAFIEGLSEGGMNQSQYKLFNSMKDALTFLGDEYCNDGDVVLIENDLPDLYESTVRF